MLETRPIFESSPAYPSCHAATVAERPGGGLLAAWFAGPREGDPDVAVWAAEFDGKRWSRPHKLADEPGIPLWNPVLFRDAADTLWLFYKLAPTIPAWTGVFLRSSDGGETWSGPTALPAGVLGPAKNKPIQLSNGDILCPTSSETWRAWTGWVEISSDGGESWSRRGPIRAPGAVQPAGPLPPVASHDTILSPAFLGVIQPAVWEYAPGRLKMLTRATKAVGAVCAAQSEDYGRTWSPATRTVVPNPNSGLDAVRLAGGCIVLACNPSREHRSPLSLLLSEDNGVTWPRRLDLETGPGEFSYPSLLQSADGRLHVVYTHRRTHIQHVTLDPYEL